MATIKTLQGLIGDVKSFLRAFNKSLDTSTNSLAYDLIVYPLSVGGRIVMREVQKVADLHILSRLEGTDLNNEAGNYKKERSTGSHATVTLTFYANTLPTSDIVIPAGAEARTSGTSYTSPVIFTTTAELRVPTTSFGAYYSYDRDRYEFTVSATANTVGTIGNVGAGFITSLSTSIDGIDGVTNRTAAIGGEGEELSLDFRERIRLAKLGRDLNTKAGIKSFLLDISFKDAHAVKSEDDDSERITGTDVFVVDEEVGTEVDTFTYDAAQPRYYFSKRPIIGVYSVVASTVGTLGSSQFSVTKDSESPLRRSTEAVDYIEISELASLTNGESFQVTYTYAETLYNTQPTFATAENNILTADVLLKQAYPLYLYLNAKLTLLPNADGATVRNRVRNALSQYINENYKLGDNIQKSDLVVILQEGYGDYPVESVDAVIINSYILRDEDGNSTTPTDEVISVADKQYVLLGQATIV